MIGRAEEPEATAEIELVSSTSTDICELWNGVGIVRVVGQPDILELVIYEDEGVPYEGSGSETRNEKKANDKQRNVRIYTREKGLRVVNDHESKTNIDVEGDIASMIHPNISLNTIGRAIGDWELRVVAIVGVLLQSGVLVWDGVVTYHLHWTKGGDEISPYGFLLTVAGTLGLVLGMYLCAYIVEASTRELKWQPEDHTASKKNGTLRIVWIQRHQMVGDQSFGSFAIYAPGKDANVDLMTSHRPPNDHSSNFHKLTLPASPLSVIAFVLQFVELRAMHYSATIAQLIVTVIITLLRVIIRRHISQAPNDLSKSTRSSPSRTEGNNPQTEVPATNIAENQRLTPFSLELASQQHHRDQNNTDTMRVNNTDADQAVQTDPYSSKMSVLHELPSDGKFAVQRLQKGFELDTMAMQMEKCLCWEVQTSAFEAVTQHSVIHHDNTMVAALPHPQETQVHATSPQQKSLAHRVLDTRIKLGKLVKSPSQNELSNQAMRLSNTISGIANFIWKSAASGPSLLVLAPEVETLTEISWKIPLLIRDSTAIASGDQCELQYVTLSLSRRSRGAQKWTPWEADHSRIEGLLQL